jgi:deoxyribose-phosphate aldolase
MRALVQTTHSDGALLKITIESGLLSLEEKILACQLVLASGADYVKSSTGFLHAGATPADISLMRGVMGEKLGVKASGGIRTLQDAQTVIEAGASRIGTSAGVAIVQESQNKSI